MFNNVQDVVCPKRSLEILRLLERERNLNYSGIEARVDTSSDVVTDRLNVLVQYRLLERKEKSPKDVRYQITDRGRELLELVQGVDAFLEKSKDVHS